MSAATATEREIHPVADLFPMLPNAELRELAASIKKNGLLEPITMKGKQVVDGRNRLAACEIAGVKPTFSQWKAARGVTVEAWIIAKNLNRRHLDESQRARLAVRLADLLPIGKDGAGQTERRAAAAESMNVSARSVERAAVVVEKGGRALNDAVESGEVAVSAAAEVATLPKSEQAAIVKSGPKAVAAKAREIREEKRSAPKPARQPASEQAPEEPAANAGELQRKFKPLIKSVSSFTKALEKAGIVSDGAVDTGLVDAMLKAGRPLLAKRATGWTVRDLKNATLGTAALWEIARKLYAGQR